MTDKHIMAERLLEALKPHIMEQDSEAVGMVLIGIGTSVLLAKGNIPALQSALMASALQSGLDMGGETKH